MTVTNVLKIICFVARREYLLTGNYFTKDKYAFSIYIYCMFTKSLLYSQVKMS